MGYVYVFLHFPSGVNKVNTAIDQTVGDIAKLEVYAITAHVPAASNPAVMMSFDGFTADIVSEGLSGFPVPLYHNGVANAEMRTPITVSHTMRARLGSLIVRLDSVDGTAFVHTEFNAWLRLTTVGVDRDRTGTLSGWPMELSGVGLNDTRWPDIPTPEEVQQSINSIRSPK